MLEKNQIIKTKWNKNTKKYYIQKGYIFTNLGEELLITIKDLTKGSHEVVCVICDYCGKTMYKQYCVYLQQHSEKFGDCCSICSPKKHAKICMEKYGVVNVSQVDSVKNKRKETFMKHFGCINPSQSEIVKLKKVSTVLKNYGVTSPLQSKIIQEKSKQTCLNRYGVPYTTQNDTMKTKSRQTCMLKYGVDNVSKSPEIKKRIVTTWLNKYGVKNIMELSEFREKILKSFVSNGTAPTSSMQIRVSNLLKEVFGEYNVQDNVPYDSCLLDMVLTYQGYQINVEYDGWFWHKKKLKQDQRRNYYLIDRGFKVLRIRSNVELPTKEQIINGIDYLIKDNHALCYIDLDIR